MKWVQSVMANVFNSLKIKINFYTRHILGVIEQRSGHSFFGIWARARSLYQKSQFLINLNEDASLVLTEPGVTSEIISLERKNIQWVAWVVAMLNVFSHSI